MSSLVGVEARADASLRGKWLPIQRWALVGAAFLALEVYVLAAWILTGNAQRTPAGPDEVPAWMNVAVRSVEIGGVVALLVCGYLLLVRPRRRTGEISWDGRLMLALMSLYMLHDPLANYFETWFTFNAHFVNLGSWGGNIPGWQSDHGNRLADPLIFNITSFGYMFIGVILLGNAAMRRIERRYDLSQRGVVVAMIAMFIVFMLVLEPFFMLLGFWSYPGAVSWLTINHGHYYQYPIYEAFLLGTCWGVLALLRHTRNDSGESWPERGLNKLGGSTRRRATVRFLAIAGCCHLVFFLYFVSLQPFALMSEKWPQDVIDRSYLTNGLCGEEQGC